MPKCPNCGSTAQVRLTAADDLNDTATANNNWIYQHYTCGCGARFFVTWIKEGTFLK